MAILVAEDCFVDLDFASSTMVLASLFERLLLCYSVGVASRQRQHVSPVQTIVVLVSLVLVPLSYCQTMSIGIGLAAKEQSQHYHYNIGEPILL